MFPQVKADSLESFRSQKIPQHFISTGKVLQKDGFEQLPGSSFHLRTSSSTALARFSDPHNLGLDWRSLTRDLPRRGVPFGALRRFQGLPFRPGPAGFKAQPTGGLSWVWELLWWKTCASYGHDQVLLSWMKDILYSMVSRCKQVVMTCWFTNMMIESYM